MYAPIVVGLSGRPISTESDLTLVLKVTLARAARQTCVFRAFDLGITCFDLANNYGTPRDELSVSSKARYRMWPVPYGAWELRKDIIAS